MTAFIFSPLLSPALLPMWEGLEFASIIIVGIGCWGEVWAEHHKFSDDPNNILPNDLINKKWIRVFWLMVVWGLALELVAFGFAFIASNKEIEGLQKSNWEMQTNVASLNGAVIQLAHQYDLSTNALAEANARLSLIKPIKERLVDCLNIIAPEIVAALKKNSTRRVVLC